MGGCKSLQWLYVRGNQLLTLPVTLGALTNLRGLNAAENRLNELPSSMGLLVELIDCNLSYNNLTYLPVELGACVNLKSLYLIGNPMARLYEVTGAELRKQLQKRMPSAAMLKDAELLSGVGLQVGPNRMSASTQTERTANNQASVGTQTTETGGTRSFLNSAGLNGVCRSGAEGRLAGREVRLSRPGWRCVKPALAMLC